MAEKRKSGASGGGSSKGVVNNLSKLNEVYRELIQPLPDEAIERAPKEKTRKGYDTTGYQYQYLVERLNEVVGIENWYMTNEVVKEIEGQFNNGAPSYEITVRTTVVVMGVSKTAGGGHKSSCYADAFKGAITNGFKKTVALFGLGQEAYKGMIDEDYQAPYEERPARTKPPVKQPQKRQTARPPRRNTRKDKTSAVDYKEEAKKYVRRLKWNIHGAKEYLGDTSKYDEGDWKLALQNLEKECKKKGV